MSTIKSIKTNHKIPEIFGTKNILTKVAATKPLMKLSIVNGNNNNVKSKKINRKKNGSIAKLPRGV